MRAAWAEDSVLAPDPAVLNEPVESVNLVKEIINRINPSYETVWDVYNGEFSQGISGSLYNFTSRTIPIASVRLGASTGMAIYSGVSLDLPGLSRRFIPQTVQTAAETSPLDTIWGFVGKYARVGLVAGYSWDQHDPVIGITAGAALSF